MRPSSDEVTTMLRAVRRGERDAVDRLLPLIYGELRRCAGRAMRSQRPDHTLQPTALAHEAYLRLVREPDVEWQNRAHFYGFAATVMRNILVDHARARSAGKRGGKALRVDLDEGLGVAAKKDESLMAVDDALSALAELDPRKSRIVELRFFAGLTVEEVAEVLGVSPAAVKREWVVAKAWLKRELTEGGSG